MACFVCDEKQTVCKPCSNANGQAGDCSRCGPRVVLNWKNGQHVLEHMAAHILHDNLLDSSEELCGLCLRPAPMCQLYLRKPRGTSANVSVDYKRSSCINLIHFNYATASTSSEASPCSNVPISCPLCPAESPAVWTYSLHAHFRGKHRIRSPLTSLSNSLCLNLRIMACETSGVCDTSSPKPAISNRRN